GGSARCSHRLMWWHRRSSIAQRIGASNCCSGLVFVWGERRQRQRMDAGRKLLGERLIDKALSGNPPLADKGGRGDGNGKVRFAFRPIALVSGMTVRLVCDLEPGRCESLGQFATDGIGHIHSALPSEEAAAVRKPPRSSTTWWMWSPSEPAAA